MFGKLAGFVRLLFRGLCGGCKELYLFTVRPSSTMVRRNRTRPILDNVSRVSLIYLPQIGITAAKRPEFSRLSTRTQYQEGARVDMFVHKT